LEYEDEAPYERVPGWLNRMRSAFDI